MKAALLVTTFALAAAAFTVSAQAQTGRPSVIEVPQAGAVAPAVATDPALGSYGRYLMLNGATRDEAVTAARNVDHPVVRRRVASAGHAWTDAKRPVRR